MVKMLRIGQSAAKHLYYKRIFNVKLFFTMKYLSLADKDEGSTSRRRLGLDDS
jgi:hypothetical protein